MIHPTDTKPRLSTRQRENYAFLRDKILNRGYGPTVREIGPTSTSNRPTGLSAT